MKKKEKMIIGIVGLVVIIILFGMLSFTQKKLVKVYNAGREEGYNYVVNRLDLSYDEKEYPTNCSMNKFPYYLTTSDISKSREDTTRTFWIMLVSEEQWECIPDYDDYSKWCRCKFNG